MKKLMMLLAFCGLTTGVFAQEEAESYPTLKRKVVLNNFWSNWTIDAGVEHIAWYGQGERNLKLNRNPFWGERSSWGFNLSIAKWATPNFGLRVKGQGAWGVTMVSEHSTVGQYDTPSFKQWNVSVQPMLNLTNLIGGYKPRWWELSAYVGAGLVRNCSLDSYSCLMDAGLINTWNVTKRFHINLDIYGRMFTDTSFDGGDSQKYVEKYHNPFKAKDWVLGFAAGVGVNLGKVGWDNAPDMDAILANHKAQLDALNSSIAGLEAENTDLKNKLKNIKPEVREVVKTVTEFQGTSASVFFNINKSVIASKKDLVNVKELADYAKANGKKVVVTGYADSKTGSAAYNQTLSEKRAETVKKALIDMGVDAGVIETVGMGGVADLTPVSYNRRAVVTLK